MMNFVDLLEGVLVGMLIGIWAYFLAYLVAKGWYAGKPATSINIGRELIEAITKIYEKGK